MSFHLISVFDDMNLPKRPSRKKKIELLNDVILFPIFSFCCNLVIFLDELLKLSITEIFIHISILQFSSL